MCIELCASAAYRCVACEVIWTIILTLKHKRPAGLLASQSKELYMRHSQPSIGYLEILRVAQKKTKPQARSVLLKGLYTCTTQMLQELNTVGIVRDPQRRIPERHALA